MVPMPVKHGIIRRIEPSFKPRFYHHSAKIARKTTKIGAISPRVLHICCNTTNEKHMKGAQSTHSTGLWAMVSLFFLWGFVASSNTVLIPAVKEVFDLSQTQAMRIDVVFYLAYGLGGACLFFMSWLGWDLVQKLGAKGSLLLGLGFAAMGGFGFYPAAQNQSYIMLLGSLLAMGLGFSVLQMVANPYLLAMGEEAFAAQRVNFAGALNSLGTTLGPLFMGKMIFASGISSLTEIGWAYVGVGVVFTLILVFLSMVSLPEPRMTTGEAEVNEGKSLWRVPFILGMMALFVYVGTEVALSSNLAMLLEQPSFLGAKPADTVHYASLYWASLMMGRWMGAVVVLGRSEKTTFWLKLVAPFLALGVALLSMWLSGTSWENIQGLWPFALIMPVVLMVPYFLAKERPAAMLWWLSLFGAGAVVSGMWLKGPLGALLIVSAGLCCSVLWSCIFALAVQGLGKNTHRGSSLLIVMITGGAVLPPIQAAWMESGQVIQGYWVPVLGFLAMALYPLVIRGKMFKKEVWGS